MTEPGVNLTSLKDLLISHPIHFPLTYSLHYQGLPKCNELLIWHIFYTVDTFSTEKPTQTKEEHMCQYFTNKSSILQTNTNSFAKNSLN